MSILRSGKLIAMMVPAISITGVYASDTTDLTTRTQKYVTSNSDSAQLSASQLGMMTGPLEIGVAYSQLYGPIVSAQYTVPFGPTNSQALSVIGEGGPRQYRINGTYGFEFAKNHRIKATAEYLTQNILFNFNSGDSRQWISQGAYGAAYQYVVPSKWLNAVNASLSYANARSKNLSSVDYVNSSGATMTNLRRIAGGQAVAGLVGVEASPWKWSNLGVALNYDSVWYNTQYNSTSNNASGLGFTATAEQLITETFKASLLGSVRQPWNEFGGGLSWLAPSKKGTSLELGANFGYLQAKTTGRNDFKGGLSLAYRWNGPKDAISPVYQLTQTGKTDLADWVSKPAVYMAEVLAIADQKDIIPGSLFMLVGVPMSTVHQAGQNVDVDWGKNFNAPAGTSVTYTSSALPKGLTLDSKTGRVTGIAPADDLGPHTINVVATPAGGSPSMPVDFQMAIVSAATGAVSVQPKDLGTLPENSSNSQSIAGAFTVGGLSKTVGANAKNDGGGVPSDEVKGSYMTYSYDAGQALPEGVKSITVDPKTGLMTIQSDVVSEQINAKVKVKGQLVTKSGQAYQYQGSSNTAEISFAITPTEVTATNDTLPSVTPNTDIAPVDLDNYFKNTGTKMTYQAKSELYGLTLNGNMLQGKFNVEPGKYDIQIEGTNENQKSAVSTLTFNVIAGAITMTPVGDQTYKLGENVALPIVAEGTGKLTYSATGLPPGLSIDANGEIKGVVGLKADLNVPYKVEVTAKDAYENQASTNFTINVDTLPKIAPIPPQTGQVGQALNVQVSGIGKGSLSYTSSDLPQGLTISSSGQITGVPGSEAYGSKTSTIDMTDGQGRQTSTAFTTNIKDALAVVTTPADQLYTVDDQVNLPIQAQGTALKYSSNNLPSGLSINQDSGLISGKVAEDAKIGDTQVQVDVANRDNVKVSTQFKMTIAAGIVAQIAAVPAQNARVGQPVSIQLSGSGQGKLTYDAQGLPVGVSIDPSSGLISGTPQQRGAGSFAITAKVTDAKNTSASTNFDMTVLAAMPTVTSPGNQTYKVGDVVSLPVSATGDQLTYTATGLPPGLSIDTNGKITGTVAATAKINTPYAATVTVTDIDKQTASTPLSINVLDMAPTVNALQPTWVDAGAAVNIPVTAQGTNLKYSATGLPAGLSIDQSTGVISGTLAADALDINNVTVTATNTGGSANQQFVLNVRPVITPVADQSYTVGKPVNLKIEAQGSNVTLTSTALPAGLIFSQTDAHNALISGTPTTAAAAMAVTITAKNGAGPVSAGFKMTVAAASVPTIAVQGNGVMNYGAVVDHNMNPELQTAQAFQASSGGTVTYALKGLENVTSMNLSSVKINPSTGAISGKPKCISTNDCKKTNPRIDSFNLTVVATNTVDGKTATASSNFKLCVTRELNVLENNKAGYQDLVNCAGPGAVITTG